MELLLFRVDFIRYCWRFFTEVHRVFLTFWKNYMFLWVFFDSFLSFYQLYAPSSQKGWIRNLFQQNIEIYVLYLFCLAPAVTECSSGSDTDLRPGDQAKPFKPADEFLERNSLLILFYLCWGGNLAYITRHSLGLRGSFFYFFLLMICLPKQVLWSVPARQCCGSGSGFNGIQGSGSRRAKWPTKIEKVNKFLF